MQDFFFLNTTNKFLVSLLQSCDVLICNPHIPKLTPMKSCLIVVFWCFEDEYGLLLQTGNIFDRKTSSLTSMIFLIRDRWSLIKFLFNPLCFFSHNKYLPLYDISSLGCSPMLVWSPNLHTEAVQCTFFLPNTLEDWI